MAIVNYTQQNEYDLVNSGQDCIGWTVVDQSGRELGKITEMLINTDTDMVDSILIDRRKRIPAEDFTLADNRVIVRGISDYAGQNATSSDVAINDHNDAEQTYNNAAEKVDEHHVSGVTRAANEGEAVLPVIEEQLRVGKRTVETGGVRVSTGVEETPVETQVSLREERVRVERNPVDRLATDADFQTFKEGEIELTEHAEVPVINKEARVVEEIAVGREVSERTETIRETIRKTDVEVENFGDENIRRTANQ